MRGRQWRDCLTKLGKELRLETIRYWEASIISLKGEKHI